MTIRDLAGFFVAAAVCLQTFAEPAHPVLFASKSDFEALKRFCAEDPDGKLGRDKVLADADGMLGLPVCERKVEGFRLLGVSQQVLWRTATLAMAYRLTGNDAYARRSAAEMKAAAAFTDWNPAHFLDVAELTLALAIGYDWTYDALSGDERKIISDAIIRKGLRAEPKGRGWWVNAKNNWGQVCHAGMLAGALAVRDLDRPLAEETIRLAVEKLPISMAALAPNGCYPEGPGYWSYGMSFNVLAVALLEHAEKTDFGLIALPGFKDAFYYLDRVTGPSGSTFNYADGGDGRSTQVGLWWFAKRFNQPELLNSFEREAFRNYCRQPKKPGTGNRLLPIALLWLVPERAGPSPLKSGNWSSGGPVPIVIQRTGWDSDTAVFVGLKAGSADAPHGHMDAGSFVYEAHGKRWALDLGAEGYNGIESRGMKLWNWNQDSDRWKVFRLNNFSHNTLLIDGQIHPVKGSAKVIEFVDEGIASRAVLDMTTVYPMCSRVIRTGTMDKNGIYTLSDSLEGLKPGAKVRWQMMTRAGAVPGEKGSVTLIQRDKKLLLTAADPQTQWQTEDAEKPKNEWDSPNKGCRFVYFEAIAPASGKLDFAVTFTP